jgi:farnesyl-diphosphate farnesyltransferase
VRRIVPEPIQVPYELLKEVSRSFYLTLRVLPASIRSQISLAYLLARTSDTIADTKLLPMEERLSVLGAFRDAVLGKELAVPNFKIAAQHQSAPSERVLLENCTKILSLLQGLATEDLKLVRQVVDKIVSGQELDLLRFGNASSGNIVSLRTDEEFEDYTYRVAGCVGEFWTRICRAHVFPAAKLDENYLLERAVRFGKGLQMVNILRDLPADLRDGRCYLPVQSLNSAKLSPLDLLKPSNERQLRPVYDGYLTRAQNHLLAGWAYTTALPIRSVRVRLACSWPILIGLKTIKLLRIGNVLDPEKRIKISRAEIKKSMWRSVIYYPLVPAWRRLVQLDLEPAPQLDALR